MNAVTQTALRGVRRVTKGVAWCIYAVERLERYRECIKSHARRCDRGIASILIACTVENYSLWRNYCNCIWKLKWMKKRFVRDACGFPCAHLYCVFLSDCYRANVATIFLISSHSACYGQEASGFFSPCFHAEPSACLFRNKLYIFVLFTH